MEWEAFRGHAPDVSRETFDDLCRYSELLRKWTKSINLVAPSTLATLWTRHILDSLQLVPLVPDQARTWADLGSGGGLPGVVAAIVLKHRAIEFYFVESDRRKATFLRTAIRELHLQGKVVSARIEETQPLNADVISARALAPLGDLLAHQERHGAEKAIGLYPKGATADTEISTALEHWRFSCEKHPSATMADSYVLKIGDLQRA